MFLLANAVFSSDDDFWEGRGVHYLFRANYQQDKLQKWSGEDGVPTEVTYKDVAPLHSWCFRLSQDDSERLDKVTSAIVKRAERGLTAGKQAIKDGQVPVKDDDSGNPQEALKDDVEGNEMLDPTCASKACGPTGSAAMVSASGASSSSSRTRGATAATGASKRKSVGTSPASKALKGRARGRKSKGDDDVIALEEPF